MPDEALPASESQGWACDLASLIQIQQVGTARAPFWCVWGVELGSGSSYRILQPALGMEAEQVAGTWLGSGAWPNPDSSGVLPGQS